MDLARFVVRRLARLLLTVFIISTIIFFVIRIIPGDPALIIAGMDAPPETVQGRTGPSASSTSSGSPRSRGSTSATR
jgi:ABC-type dipeptide/oligopeptide/nickel transport system permease component